MELKTFRTNTLKHTLTTKSRS